MSEKLAKLFHETYERLAPMFGYETREESRKEWDDVPAQNKALMIAVTDVIEMEFFHALREEENGTEDEVMSLNTFTAESGYGYKSRRAFVALSYNDWKLAQMSPEEAMTLAHHIMEAAEAALNDAFLIEYLREELGMERHVIGSLIIEFRKWREKRLR